MNKSIFLDISNKSSICLFHNKKFYTNNQSIQISITVTNLWEDIQKANFQFFIYVEENKILSVHHLGFGSNDSCVNQLLATVNNLYTNFLMLTIFLTLIVYFQICLWFLTKSGTKDQYVSSNQLVFQIFY